MASPRLTLPSTLEFLHYTAKNCLEKIQNINQEVFGRMTQNPQTTASESSVKQRYATEEEEYAAAIRLSMTETRSRGKEKAHTTTEEELLVAAINMSLEQLHQCEAAVRWDVDDHGISKQVVEQSIREAAASASENLVDIPKHIIEESILDASKSAQTKEEEMIAMAIAESLKIPNYSAYGDDDYDYEFSFEDEVLGWNTSAGSSKDHCDHGANFLDHLDLSPQKIYPPEKDTMNDKDLLVELLGNTRQAREQDDFLVALGVSQSPASSNHEMMASAPQQQHSKGKKKRFTKKNFSVLDPSMLGFTTDPTSPVVILGAVETPPVDFKALKRSMIQEKGLQARIEKNPQNPRHGQNVRHDLNTRGHNIQNQADQRRLQTSYRNKEKSKSESTYRPAVLLDGEDVAFTHGEKKRYSPLGIKIAVDFFESKGCEVGALVSSAFRSTYAYTEEEKKIIESLMDSPGKRVFSLLGDYRQSLINQTTKRVTYLISNNDYEEFFIKTKVLKEDQKDVLRFVLRKKKRTYHFENNCIRIHDPQD